MIVNFGSERASKPVSWLTELGKQFAIVHDMSWTTKTRLWLKTRAGSECFVKWLQSCDWKISYWELPPYIGADGTLEYLAYGIDVDDTCTKFIETKLKHD